MPLGTCDVKPHLMQPSPRGGVCLRPRPLVAVSWHEPEAGTVKAQDTLRSGGCCGCLVNQFHHGIA